MVELRALACALRLVFCNVAKNPGRVTYGTMCLVPSSGPILDGVLSSAWRRGHWGMRSQLQGWLNCALPCLPFAAFFISGKRLSPQALLAKNGQRLARRSHWLPDYLPIQPVLLLDNFVRSPTNVGPVFCVTAPLCRSFPFVVPAPQSSSSTVLHKV